MRRGTPDMESHELFHEPKRVMDANFNFNVINKVSYFDKTHTINQPTSACCLDTDQGRYLYKQMSAWPAAHKYSTTN